MIHSHVKNENKATASQFYLAQDVIPGVFAEKWAKISSFQPGGFPHSTFFKAAPLGITLNPSGNTFVFPMTHTSFLKLMPIVSSSVNQELLFRVTGWSSQVLPMRSKEMFVPTILGEYKFTPNLGFSITSPFSYSDPHANARSVKDLTTQGILTTNQKLSGNVDPNYITLKGQGAEYIQIQMMLQEPATATGSCCNLAANSCENDVLAADCLAMNQKIWFQGTICNGYSCIWNGCPEREPPCTCTDTTTTCCPDECPDTSICPPGECQPCMVGSTVVCNTFNGICPPGTGLCLSPPCPSCSSNVPTCSTFNLIIPPHCDLGSCCCDLLGECYDINRGECAILRGINSCWEFNENTPCPSPTTCPSGIDEFGSCCDTEANTCVESFRADCLAPKVFSNGSSCFGDCTYRQVSTSDGNNISGEKNFSAVVTKFGKVRVFGNNTYPAVYAIPTDLEVIQNVQVGKSFVCALELISATPLPTSGTIKVWGQDPDSTGVLTVPTNLGPCSAISAGSSHIAVIKGTFGSPGIVQAWGNSAAIGVPSNLGQCVAIDSSGAYTAAVQAVVPAGQESLNGLRLWGVVPPVVATVPDFTGYHGSNIRIIDVSISSSNAAVIFSDGSFIVWGDNSSGQLNIPSNIGTIKQISCGKKHIIAIKSNGDVVSWGLNACLQTSMPLDLGKCVSVSAGDGYSCAVKLNGLLECWSCNQGSLDFTCNDANAAPNESPCHWTSLTNASTGFYVSTTPITNKQFSGLSASNPDQPKVNQTWDVYNTWANNQSLRLLTEAEWELAAKGGVSGPTYGVLDNIAWHLGNSGSNKNVAGKQPNAYGLYDTIGLVKEFVFDFIYPYVASSFDNPVVNPIGQITDGLTNHIIRGGSFLSPIVECRSTWRGSVHTSNTGVDIGFRVARTATASTTWITQVVQDKATALDIPDPLLRNLINNSGHSWWVRKSIGPGLFIDLKFIPNVVFNQGASSVTDSCGGNCPDINITTLPDCESLCSIIVPGKCCISTTTNGFLQGTSLKLPTEAQWEYAYRAGTTTAFHSYPAQPTGFNDDTLLGNIAWFNSNSESQTHAVGGKLANGLGLHDMSGNVYEWCRDWYSSTYYASSPLTNPPGPTTGTNRLIRGGRWETIPRYCRASKRTNYFPDNTLNSVGFRVVHESAIGESPWYEVIEQNPDVTVVTNPTLRAAIIATGRPWRVRDTVTNIEMLLIPPGTFTMGCSASLQDACDSDENPLHQVTLTTFYMGRYEVTQAQWLAKMGSNPSFFQGANYPDAASRPVERVSWNMIVGSSIIGCTQTDQEECAALGGTFTPDGQCAAGGLCNNIWGRCCNQNICQNDVLSTNCTGTNNVFTPYLTNQPGSSPRCIEDCPGQLRCVSETGKCCNPLNNDCLNTKKCSCVAPMVFTPFPAACYQLSPGNPLRCVKVVGACCNNLTNACVQNEDWQCAALGSNHSFTPGGSCSGSFCSSLVGACCNIAMGQCIDDLTLAQCSARIATSGSWVWHAAPLVCFSPTQCPEQIGKCCHPTNGNCFNTNQFTCTPGWSFTKDAFCTVNPSNNNPSCIISLPTEPCCCLPTSPACACAGRCCNKLTNLCVDHVCNCAGLAGQWVFTDNAECEICNSGCTCDGQLAGTKVCNHKVCTSIAAFCGGLDCTGNSTCSSSMYCNGNFPLGPTMNCFNPCDDCVPIGPLAACPITCGKCIDESVTPDMTTCSQFYSYNVVSTQPDVPSDILYGSPGNGNPSDAADEGAYGISTKADLCTDTNQCPGYPKKTSGSTPFVRWNRYNSGVDFTGTSQPRFIDSNLNNQLREEFDMFISCGCKDSTGKSSIDAGWNLKAKPWVCDARHQVNTNGYLAPFENIIPPQDVLNSINRSLLPPNITPKDVTGIDSDSPIMRSWPLGTSWGINKRRLRECDGRAFWANTAKKNWEILGCTDNTCTAYATDNLDINLMIGYLSIFGNNWNDTNNSPRLYSPSFQYRKFSDTTFVDTCGTCKFGSPTIGGWNLFRTVNSEALGTPFTLFANTPTSRVCPTTPNLLDSTGTTNEFTVFIQSFSS